MNGESERHAALLRWEAEEGVRSQGIWETSRHWKRQGSDYPAVFHSVQWQPSETSSRNPRSRLNLEEGKNSGSRVQPAQWLALYQARERGLGRGAAQSWLSRAHREFLVTSQPTTTAMVHISVLYPPWDPMSSLNSDPQAQGHTGPRCAPGKGGGLKIKLLPWDGSSDLQFEK